jgi:hypothetical protein
MGQSNHKQKGNDMQLATKRLIDAVWTVAYTVEGDGRVTIHGFSRQCRRGYAQEQELPRAKFIESDDGKRTALKLLVQPFKPFRHWPKEDEEGLTTYEIANPRNVFSYGEVPS